MKSFAPGNFYKVILAALKNRFRLPPPIEEPVRHLLDHPGKGLRPEIVFAVAETSNHKGAIAVAATAELIHLGSLIHDDLVDGAAMRRGVKAVHTAFNPRTAVLTGDYLFAAAYHWMMLDAKEATFRAFGPVLFALAESEILEYCLRGKILPVKTARKIALGKTGALFGWLAQAACLETSGTRRANAWKIWGENLGLLFQFADDLGDRLEIHEGKDVGLDEAAKIPTVLDALLDADKSGKQLEKEIYKLIKRISNPPVKNPRLSRTIDAITRRATDRFSLWEKS